MADLFIVIKTHRQPIILQYKDTSNGDIAAKNVKKRNNLFLIPVLMEIL